VIRSGAGDRIGVLARPVTKLLGLPACCGASFVLGALCGFPIGAVSAVKLYECGSITKAQCERLIAVSNNTGPAFVIGVVGAAFWNSRAFGVMLYAAQIISAVIAASIVFFVSGKDDKQEVCIASAQPQVRRSVADDITDAVTSSSHNILSVCGYVVFFSVAVGLVSSGLDAVGYHEGIGLIISSIAEFTVGSRYAASVGGVVGMAAAGFTIGWSGLSVLFQSSVFTSRCGISLSTAVRCKLLQGLICSAVCAVLGKSLISFAGGEVAAGAYFSAEPTVTAAIFTVLIVINIIGTVNKIFKESI
jgi:hypothetical protein